MKRSKEGGREGTHLSFHLLGIHVVARLKVIRDQASDSRGVLVRPRREADNAAPSFHETVPEVVSPPERRHGADTRDHHLVGGKEGGREGGKARV